MKTQVVSYENNTHTHLSAVTHIEHNKNVNTVFSGIPFHSRMHGNLKNTTVHVHHSWIIYAENHIKVFQFLLTNTNYGCFGKGILVYIHTISALCSMHNSR